MNPRNLLNLVLALLVAGLGLVVWHTGQAPPPTPPERISDIERQDIDRIEIRAAGPAAILERRGSDWWLVQPFTARADRDRVEAVFGLARATSLARYPAEAVDAGQAGLERPGLEIRLGDLRLRLGDTEPLRGRRFVRVGDTVHLVLDRYSHLLRGGPAALVDPRPLPPGARLRELRLPGLRLIADGDRWRLAGSGPSEETPALVERWLEARALRVSRLDDDSGSGEDVTLILAGEQPPLHFRLQRNADEWRLILPEPGLVYHFTPETGRALLDPAPEGGAGHA